MTMGRTLGLAVLFVGLVVTVAAVGGILEGSFAQSAGWRPFVAALAGIVVGVALMGWGGTKYAGVGARI